MATEIDQTFTGLKIDLDGSSYRNCTFVDCTINYSGGPVILDGPVFKNCELKLNGAAAATIALLIELEDTCPELVQPVIEQINGSIVER